MKWCASESIPNPFAGRVVAAVLILVSNYVIDTLQTTYHWSMRPLLLSLCFTSLVSSKYYSDGWKPGSPAQTAVNPGRTFDPHKPPPSTSGGFNSLLTGGPIGALLTSFGINMTEKIEEARIKEENKWDRRIPLIHDDNFDHLITHEKMSLPEEAERIWFILMYDLSQQHSYFYLTTHSEPSRQRKKMAFPSSLTTSSTRPTK